jgi:hypothetical protein
MKLPDAELQRQEPVIGERQCCIQDDAHPRRAVRVARLRVPSTRFVPN